MENYMYDVKRLQELIHEKNVVELKRFVAQHNLVVEGDRIVPCPEARAEFARLAGFWNQRQAARKILLNSCYGALLNEAMRLSDPRLGQSTTLSGRSIVRHMNAKINQIITGEYDYKGAAVYASDTDSCYFSVYEFLRTQPEYENFDWSRESIIEMYDLIAEEVNASFPQFMDQTFHTGLTRGAYIKAGRELVASKGLFIKKKKYAVLIYDLEGKRLDVDGKPGKLKAMGLDLKRSDTPKFMQRFLEALLMDLLTGKSKEAMYDSIRTFRNEFKQRPGWEKGAPKKVSNLSAFGDKLKKANNTDLTERVRGSLKVNMPGHVLASLNWNKLCEVFDDRHSMRITDSARIIVCKLLKNSYDMTSIAYPIDQAHLPDWFRELPFDHAAMEETIIDNKLDNLVGVLEWDLTDTKEKGGDEFFSFD
jgi:hypothetical protein